MPAIEAAMYGRHALVRDLAVFREQNLANLSYFSDDNPAALASRIQDLARRSDCLADASTLPNWKDCVGDMLSQLGLRTAGQPSIGRHNSFVTE